MFTHFSTSSRCEVCVNAPKSPQPRAEKMRSRDGSTSCAQQDLSTTLVLIVKFSEENESRLQRRYAVVVQDLCSKWIHCCPKRNQTAPDTMEQRFLPPEATQTIFVTLSNVATICAQIATSHTRIYRRPTELPKELGEESKKALLL